MRYGEPLSDARTPLADFFRILLIVKRMNDVFGKLQCLLVQEDEVGRQGGVVNS
ncbi:protein of unknown function [Nitrospira defluvii]|uniref:Uncharacterized protein n=1 Tax=Nitrospira defluvii TaxID=330214 RepID=D8PF94_9BACT|nr:protein of unknown function [Nitrospira defluvii]